MAGQAGQGRTEKSGQREQAGQAAGQGKTSRADGQHRGRAGQGRAG